MKRCDFEDRPMKDQSLLIGRSNQSINRQRQKNYTVHFIWFCLLHYEGKIVIASQSINQRNDHVNIFCTIQSNNQSSDNDFYVEKEGNIIMWEEKLSPTRQISLCIPFFPGVPPPPRREESKSEWEKMSSRGKLNMRKIPKSGIWIYTAQKYGLKWRAICRAAAIHHVFRSNTGDLL